MSLLLIDNLSKSFKKKKVLNGLNLSVEKGEVIGLVGRSGVGKSVLVKTLIGFLKPDAGYLAIHSESKFPIGFSMQENAIYDSLTVRQNLKYFSEIYKIPRKERKNGIKLVLDKLNLEEFGDVLVKKLSGGTKKRVDIACALLTEPEIIVLDEPFLGLDPVLVDSLSQFILLLQKSGKTIIVSSHRTDELSKICTRLILLKGGKLYQINKSQLKNVY
ncbi:MAG: ABC transporter ATP-binding protein [Nanoarchaeota archaeon]